MKSIIKKIVLLIPVVIVLSGCEGTHTQFDFSEYDKIYMPQAKEYPAVRQIIVIDSVQTIEYNAAYAGANTPNTSINITFHVNSALVDSFNTDNFTSYPILPEGAYELTETEATIPAGERGTGRIDMELMPEGNIQAGGNMYLLPVSIEAENSEVPLNEEMNTTYFLIEGSYRDIDKSDWQVIDFDSQQPGRDDLAAANIIDGDNGTIWNTQYTDPRPDYPHYATIDMGEENFVHGFEIVGRYPRFLNQNPKDITIEFSDDGQNWRDGEDFITAMDLDETYIDRIYLTDPVQARYFKFTVNQGVSEDADLLNMAEITAF